MNLLRLALSCPISTQLSRASTPAHSGHEVLVNLIPLLQGILCEHDAPVTQTIDTISCETAAPLAKQLNKIMNRCQALLGNPVTAVQESPRLVGCVLHYSWYGDPFLGMKASVDCLDRFSSLHNPTARLLMPVSALFGESVRDKGHKRL